MQLRKILCPVDFSEGSRGAMRFAIELATEAGAALTLLYVWQTPRWATSAISGIGDAIQVAIDRDTKELEKWTAEARAAGVGKVTSEFLEGIPWESIVRMAKDDRAIDLIVMGTHGRTGLKAALIGSVAEKVVRHAPCRVLITRDRAEHA